ncbi:MAG: MATE family efflux transporter [Candidatus Riflebacteria bacterium]|nr:MATE family efflux transporter [Candidatus Riflebacteria bacterium]
MLLKKILHIALPALSGFLGLILFDVVDIYWIEKLGGDALSGVAAAGFIVWSLYSVMNITSGGAASLIAQYHGAQDREKAWDTVIQAVSFSLLISLIVTLAVYPNMTLIFELMGLTPETMSQAISYFKLLICGFAVMYIDMLGGTIFNAYSDNKISNAIMFLCLIINGVLDPILMFGWLGFPKMGIEGAAWATLIGHFVSLVLRYAILRKRAYIPPFKDFFCARHNLYKKIAAIGFPNAATSWVWSIIYPILTRLIAPYGMVHVSAVGVCHRIESFPYYTATALGIAMTTIVGNAVGKKQTEEIDRITYTGIRIGTIVSLPFAVLFMFYPEYLMKLLTTDFKLISAGAAYLKIIGICEILMAWELVLGGVFTGIGVTGPTLLITLPITLARIPAAWILAQYCGFGVNGIWAAISFSTALKGVGLLILYRHMRKKRNLANFTSERKIYA